MVDPSARRIYHRAMSGAFISYRRDDAGGAAGRLYDRLCERFGRSRVFRDVDTIEPGERFVHAIEEKLARTDVLIALIGREWVASADDQGRPRLHDASDFVRLEIATALRRGIPVIPALLEHAAMPRAEELPPDLAPLAQCQAIEIDDADFHADVDRLIAILEPRIRPEKKRLPEAWRRLALPSLLAVVGIAIVVLGFVVFGRGPRSNGSPNAVALRAEPTVLSPEQVSALIIQWGFYSAHSNPAGPGVAHDYRQMVSEGAPVVVDGATGLMWEHRGSGRIEQGGQTGAAAYVRSLNGRQLGGFTDWRLPTLEEALSLLTAELHGEFHLDPAFAAATAPFIWTADADDDGRGWVVYYLDGIAGSEDLDFNAFVRAVRSL